MDRYIDVFPQFVRAYNDSVHSTIGIAPSKVTNLDVLAVWKKTNNNRHIRSVKAKFRVGQHVSISKMKMKFAKGADQNYSLQIFRINKLILRSPRPLYELEDLKETPIEGPLYQEELTPMRITKQTTYKIVKS